MLGFHHCIMSKWASSNALRSKNKKKKRSRGDQFEVVMNKVVGELLTSQEKMSPSTWN